jgi:hypothetical protein
VTYEHAIQTGARWLRREAWGPTRWCYLIVRTGEVMGEMTIFDRRATDWVVLHRTPPNITPIEKPPTFARKKPRPHGPGRKKT